VTKMRKKQIYLGVVSATVICLALACVSASSLPNSPLYALRMEQHSNKMNFLPTAMNGFTYNAAAGHTLGHEVSGGCGPVLRGTDATCHPTCDGSTCETCSPTCPWTCWYTCDDPTCGSTCPLEQCYPTGVLTVCTCNTCEDSCDTYCPVCEPQQ